MTKTDSSNDFPSILALQLILLPLVILTISVLCFMAGFPVNGIIFPLALGVTVGISLIPLKRGSKRPLLKATAVFIILITVSFLISATVYDFSWDGQVYHQAAVILLEKGWNPFYYNFLGAQDYRFWKAAGDAGPIIEHYSKASWILAASVYTFTGSLEGGKMFHFLFMAAVFLSALEFLSFLKRIRGTAKFIIAALAALNPVSLYQVSSFYNDGLLASMLTILMLSALRYIMFDDGRALFIMAIIIPTLVNIKFTGLAYSGVVLALTGAAVGIAGRIPRKRFIVSIGAAFLFAVGFIGFQPYITNIIHKGNPFYPVYRLGESEKGAPNNIEIGQAPAAFMNQNRFVKLGYSLFSYACNDIEKMPRLKIPFYVASWEIPPLGYTDVRYSGFGPLFGSALILVIIGAGVAALKSKRIILIYSSTAAAVILISALINPEAWWARLSPQLWLLPLVFIIASYYRRKNKFLRYLRNFVIAVLIIDCFIIMGRYSKFNLELNGLFKDQMRRMARISHISNTRYLVAPYNSYLSTERRLNTFHVRYKMVEKLEPRHATPIVGAIGAKFAIEGNRPAARGAN